MAKKMIELIRIKIKMLNLKIRNRKRNWEKEFQWQAKQQFKNK